MSTEFTIVGVINDASYQRCSLMAQDIARENKKVQVETIPLVETDFKEYLNRETLNLTKEGPKHNTSPLVFYNGKHYVGGLDEFIDLAAMKYSYTNDTSETEWQQRADVAFRKYCADSEHQFCYMDIGIDGAKTGRLVIELYSDVCPKTCENFKSLCNGDGPKYGNKTLHYKHNEFHRVVPGGWIQAGDLVNNGDGDGEGGSIYGKYFEDESFVVLHDRPGIISMASSGPHMNGSQFFITLGPAEWLDQTKVAFGRVISGMDIVREIESVETKKERPVVSCIIQDCGELDNLQ